MHTMSCDHNRTALISQSDSGFAERGRYHRKGNGRKPSDQIKSNQAPPRMVRGDEKRKREFLEWASGNNNNKDCARCPTSRFVVAHLGTLKSGFWVLLFENLMLSAEL